MISGGFDIFWAAILAVLRDWRVALKIALLPALIAAAVYALDQYFWVLALDTGEDYRGFGTISVIVDVVMVGLVAGAWHRFALLGIAPAAVYPVIPLMTAVAYGIYWMAIGIFVGLMMVAGYMAVAFVAEFMNAFSFVISLDRFFQDISNPVTLFVLGTVFVYFLLRLGLGLPDLAVGLRHITIIASIRRTRPFRAKVIVLAVLVGIAQMPFFSYPELVGDAFFSGRPSQVAFHNMVSGLLRGVVTIFGASILTELYRATGGLPVEPDEKSGGGPLERQED